MKDELYRQLTKALDIAISAHKGQVDKAGRDYIFHPITVALECETTEEKIVALLHDTVEDCEQIDFEYLETKGFSKEIIDALKLVTHIKNENIEDPHEEYRDYVRKLKASGNKIAINVKLADLKHNTDTTRLNENKPPKYDDYIWAINYLESC